MRLLMSLSCWDSSAGNAFATGDEELTSREMLAAVDFMKPLLRMKDASAAAAEADLLLAAGLLRGGGGCVVSTRSDRLVV